MIRSTAPGATSSSSTTATSGRPTIAAPVYRLSKTPSEITSLAPRLGEDGAAVLQDWLGLPEAECDELREAGAYWMAT